MNIGTGWVMDHGSFYCSTITAFKNDHQCGQCSSNAKFHLFFRSVISTKIPDSFITHFPAQTKVNALLSRGLGRCKGFIYARGLTSQITNNMSWQRDKED